MTLKQLYITEDYVAIKADECHCTIMAIISLIQT